MDDNEQYTDPGSCPKFGAIFMANNATKRECLRRRVFALPSWQSYFVKQVKAGMILFLFEFERRELYGVFQACSDGAMNILPHAFSSSGKQFPAQVKFTPMWYCHPLSENEFRNAIRENYFSKYKFKFGLSEVQVRRLLFLFSSKRLNEQAPPRQLTRSKVARPSRYSTRKIRRVVDNDRFPLSNQVIGECDVNNHGPVISTMHHEDSLYNNDRAADDARFGTYTNVGYEHKASAFLNECFQDLMGKVGRNIDTGECATSDTVDVEHNTGIKPQPPVPVGHSLGNFRSISNDVRFTKSDRLETECYNDDGFASTISPAFPSSFQFKVDPHAYASKHVLETDSFIHEPTRLSSAFLPSMELRDSNVSYPRTTEDSIVTTTRPYDPDVPAINCRGSSSLGFDLGHASLQEQTNHDIFASNVFSSSNNQSFPSLLETRRTTIIPDVNSGSRDFMSSSYSNQYESSSRTSLPRYACSDADKATEYGEDLSHLKSSLAPVPSEIRNNVSMSEHPASYRASPSKFPYLTFSDRYSMLLQDKHNAQVPEHENNAECQNDVFMFKEGQHHGDSFYNDNRAIEDGRFLTCKDVEYERENQHQLHVHEPLNMDYHEVSTLIPSACQNTECFYPDPPKKRSSVFSRLALPPKACEQESYTTPGTGNIYRNTSVNEVMDMLHNSCYHWVKTRSKQSAEHHDNAANFRDKKQAIRKEGLAMTSKGMNLKPVPFGKEKSSQKTEDTTSVDFKRHSAMRKNFEDGKRGKHCGSLENLNPVQFSKESSSQEAEHTTSLDFKRRSVVRKKLEDGKVGKHCESLDNLKPVRFSMENSSQKTEDTTFVDFKRRSAVRKNLEDGKTGNPSESPENNSASASQRKRRKLIRPNFSQNVSSDRGKSGDAQEIVIASSTEHSVSKNAESINFSVCHVNENDISHNVKLSNVVCQTAVEGDKIDNESGSRSEQLSVESFIPSRSAHESGKESSPTHGISGMTSVSSGDMHIGLEQDLRGKDIGMDELFQNHNNVSHSTHGSSPNLCEDNDINGVVKNEFFYNIEQINDLCPVRGEMSVSNINEMKSPPASLGLSVHILQ